MSEARVQRRMTPDEFFEWQADQDRNYELVDGVPVLPVKAMTGASLRHDYVTVNVLASLRNQLRGKPCRPHTDDIAVRSPNRNVRRPDIVVDGRSSPDAKQSPTVIVWRRGASGWQSETVQGLDASIPLPEIEAALPLAEVYEDVTFPAPGE